MTKNLSHIINVMFVPILFVFTIWLVKGYELISEISLAGLAVFPWNTEKILNIFTFPLVHADFSHLLNNTYPIIILGAIISSVYKEISNTVFFLSYILSGIIFWFLGDSIPVIGASGVVYALGSFVLFSGFIKKQPRLAMLSFLVIFLNFFNLWGIIEIENDNISQTAHLSGAIAGLIIAVVFKNKGPQAKKYNYELEEELEEEQKQKDININYIYKNKENTSEQRPGVANSWKNLFPASQSPTQNDLDSKASKLKKMFADHGVDVTVIADRSITGLGQVDPTPPGEKPVIRIDPYTAREDTIAHEFAHIYLDLLGLDNPVVQEALKEINNYKTRYGWLSMHMYDHYPEYRGDMYDKEILATAIGLEYVRMNKKFTNELKKLTRADHNSEELGWFKKLINAIKDFWNNLVIGSDQNTKIEELTKDLFTGNLRVEEFTGEFNPALQQSRDQEKIKKLIIEQKVRVQGQINLANKMPLDKRETLLPRLEKLQSSLKNIKKIEDFSDFVNSMGTSLALSKIEYDKIMKIPINQRATSENLNSIFKLKGELDGINAIKAIKGIMLSKKSKFAKISNPKNLKGEAFAQLHGFSDWKHVLNSLNKRQNKLKHAEITKERFDALSNEEIKELAILSESATTQVKRTTTRFDKMEARIVGILDQFETLDTDFIDNVIPILAEKLLPLHNKNIDKGIDDLIQNFEEGKKKGIYRYVGIVNSPELSDLKEQRASEEITEQEFKEKRTNLAIEQLKNRKINNRGDLIRQMRTAHRDKSAFSYFFDPIIWSSEPVIQLFAKSVSTQNIEANDDTLFFKGEMAHEYDLFTKGVNDFNVSKLNEDLIEEITVEVYNPKLKKNERKTVLAYINPIDQNKFYTQQLNSERVLAEKYNKPKREDYKDEITFVEARKEWFKTSNGRNFLKQTKKWVNENTEPVEGWKKERDAIQNRIKAAQKIKQETDNPAIAQEQDDKIKRLRQILSQNMIGQQNPIPRNEWVQPKKSKYANPKYAKIQADPRLKRYYDFVIKSMNEGHDIVGPHRMAGKNKWDKYSYLLPSIRKQVIDRGVEQNFLKTGKDLLKDSFTIQETNDDFGIYADLSGDLVRQVPVYHTNLVDAKDVSKDVASSLYRWMNMAYKFKAKDKVVGEVMLFRMVMEKRGTLEVSSAGMEQVNRVAEQLGVKLPVLKKGESYTFRHIKDWIDVAMFGQEELKQEFNLFGKSLSATKVAGALTKFTAINNLAFNLLQSTNQYVMDNMSMLQEAIAGEFMTKKDLLWARSQAYSEGMGLKDIGEFMPQTKLGKAMEFFDALVEVTDREGNRLVGNKARKALQSGNLMVLQQAVEYQLSATRMLGLMKNLEGKLKDKNGNVIQRNGKNANLYDLLKIDEKGRMSLDPELSEDSFNRNDFIHLLRGLGRRTNQIKGKFDQGMINRTWYGKMINLFRSWVPSGIRRRYGHGGFTGSTIHTDEELGTTTQGYYISFANMFTESWENKAMPWVTYDHMTEMEQQNVKRALTEAAALIATGILINMLSNLDDDEETWVSNFVLYQATRYQMEILQWTPGVGTKEALRIMKSPTATARPIEDGIEILDQVFFQEFPYLFGMGDEKDIFYQRRTGRYNKGDRKIKKQFHDLLPVLRGLERSKTPEEAQKWFNSVR